MDMVILYFSLRNIYVRVIGVLLVFIFSVTLSYAQTSTTSSSTAPTETIQAQTPHEKVTNTVREGIAKMRQTRVKNLSANISNRFDALIARFETITSRLETRVQKMKAGGYAVDAVQTKLHEVRNEIAQAKTSMTGIDIKIARVVGSEKPQETWQEVKNTFIQTHQQITKIKRLLQEIISSLRRSISDGSIPAIVVDTSTSTTEISN
jgi:uncharacterized protein YukE